MFRNLALAALLTCVALSASPASAATFKIINGDQSGEGFNDVTPADAVGGNEGESIGEQRMNAARHAADIWGAAIDSDVVIEVAMSFDPLFCDSDGAVIGAAGPNCVHSNFPGAPRRDTLYPSALANKLFGADLCPRDSDCLCPSADITVLFNSTVGTSCNNSATFYLGLDGEGGDGQFDLVTVLLHEFAHGLGFSTFVDLESGKRLSGLDDHFMIHLRDSSRRLDWDEMPYNVERKVSALDNFDLHWNGSSVSASTGVLRLGLDESTGRAYMYGPETLQLGSSVSHFDISMSPNQLMEPFYVGTNHQLSLSARLMEDIGWGEVHEGDGGGIGDGEPVACGDVDGSGVLTAGDAYSILRKAVQLDVFCPEYLCDSDNSGQITSRDSLRVLREAVEIDSDLECGSPTSVMVRMTSTQSFGSLQIEVDASTVDGEFIGEGPAVLCQLQIIVLDLDDPENPIISHAFNRAEDARLAAGFLADEEQGGAFAPRSLVKCEFDYDDPIGRTDFKVRIIEARDISGATLTDAEVIAFPN